MANVFIYCPRRSQSALDLLRGLGARRLRQFDGESFWDKRRRVQVPNDSVIVCWGAPLPKINGIRMLNAVLKPMNKYQQFEAFINHGVPTVQMRAPSRKNSYGVTHEQFIQGGWFPRTNWHQGGADFLAPIERIDFYTKKENFLKEYRIHSFDGKSIRAGEKVLRDGFTLPTPGTEWRPNNVGIAHPWVRSFDAGWRVKYDGFQSTPEMRALAASGVKALGLTFGAVDMGQTADGLMIIEVNSAPGIEGGTLQAYIAKITKWIEENKPEEQIPTPSIPLFGLEEAIRYDEDDDLDEDPDEPDED
jgi:hypothetical protein